MRFNDFISERKKKDIPASQNCDCATNLFAECIVISESVNPT